MKDEENRRIHQYIDALEKTNKHLILALQKIFEYTARLEQSRTDAAPRVNIKSDRSAGTMSPLDEKLSKPTIPLFEKILSMSEDEQRSLLKRLDKTGDIQRG